MPRETGANEVTGGTTQALGYCPASAWPSRDPRSSAGNGIPDGYSDIGRWHRGHRSQWGNKEGRGEESKKGLNRRNHDSGRPAAEDHLQVATDVPSGKEDYTLRAGALASGKSTTYDHSAF